MHQSTWNTIDAFAEDEHQSIPAICWVCLKLWYLQLPHIISPTNMRSKHHFRTVMALSSNTMEWNDGPFVSSFNRPSGQTGPPALKVLGLRLVFLDSFPASNDSMARQLCAAAAGATEPSETNPTAGGLGVVATIFTEDPWRCSRDSRILGWNMWCKFHTLNLQWVWNIWNRSGNEWRSLIVQ